MNTATGLLCGALLLAGCHRSATTQPPTLDSLVGSHLEGDYEQVLYWCPLYLEEPLSQPRLSDWCLYGLPAAMWLSFDTTRALDMLRAVCTDIPTGRLRGDEEFRMYYAGEVVRWFALSLRAQKRETTLARARNSMVQEISEVCGLDPGVVVLASEAQLYKR